MWEQKLMQSGAINPAQSSVESHLYHNSMSNYDMSSYLFPGTAASGTTYPYAYPPADALLRGIDPSHLAPGRPQPYMTPTTNWPAQPQLMVNMQSGSSSGGKRKLNETFGKSGKRQQLPQRSNQVPQLDGGDDDEDEDEDEAAFSSDKAQFYGAPLSGQSAGHLVRPIARPASSTIPIPQPPNAFAPPSRIAPQPLNVGNGNNGGGLEESEEEEEEEEAEKKKPAPRKGRGKKAEPEPVKEEEEEKKPAPRKGRGKKAEAEPVKEEEEVKPAAKKSKKGAKATDDMDVEEEESKMISVIKKGAAVVDSECPVASKVHVYCQGNDVFDANLNQTNVKANNNKFYRIQVLESDSGGQFWCWNRWGRVGAKGQNSNQLFTSAQAAVAAFKSKFLDKTRNSWDNRHHFVPHAGKYTLLEMDYGNEEEEAKPEKKAKAKADKPEVESKLHPRVKNLVELICDLRMMKNQMVEIGYDVKKMPLGKISKRMIQQGYEVLKEIESVLTAKKKGDNSWKQMSSLEDLSSRFFTIVPHDFGFKHMSNFIIRDEQTLKAKLQMIESLADIEIATKLLEDEGGEDSEEPAVDVHYKRLKTEMVPVDRSEEEFKLVQQYVKNTHAATHNQYSLEIEDLFKLEREGEESLFQDYKDFENRQLLWHGSRLTNFVGILSQGLRIAPPEAPVTGYMFGKGVYFADMVSKSANYCFTNPSNNTGLLLLCEVALGDMNEKLQADYNASDLPRGKHSTKGLGKTFPNPDEFKTLDNGTVVPCGSSVTKDIPGSSLMYNEFIVYDTKQIKIRYMVRTKFNYKLRY
eukprot:GILJ01001057.1.p1 GENE.GILJ01001057.1~~GILJ01001057.1.p1  ORF type:complete len:855 (-),score=177.28 GILJ01001057.1:120-2531(-)